MTDKSFVNVGFDTNTNRTPSIVLANGVIEDEQHLFVTREEKDKIGALSNNSVLSVNGLSGSVIITLPTSASQLVNDLSYQTASQVSASIAVISTLIASVSASVIINRSRTDAISGSVINITSTLNSVSASVIQNGTNITNISASLNLTSSSLSTVAVNLTNISASVIQNTTNIASISSSLSLVSASVELIKVSLAKKVEYTGSVSYANMLTYATGSVMKVVKVDVDENKGQTNTVYQLWPDGTRMWMAGLKDN